MAEPVVHIRGLTFTYSGSAAPVLNNINLQVNAGEFLTVTGPSGCGKSTLALCLAGFIPYAFPGEMEGVVLIDGKDTRDYPAGGLSGIVGLVQQDPEAQLCTMTVRDEVAFGPENLCVTPEEIGERVRFALQAVGALDLQDRQVHTLSGGEKQKVAIASVLAMKPLLLILDEPTANLDPRSTREVLQVLEKLRTEQATSIIVVEHRLERLLPLSDRLLVMEKGRIVEEKVEPLDSWVAGQAKKQTVGQEKMEPGNANVSVGVDDPARPRAPLLSVENLRAGYAGVDVLTGISLNLYAEDIVALMGDNGSGKTTLVLSLLGLIKPAEGSIRLRGEEISGEKVTKRAREMGLTFQNPNHQLFEENVFREAALPSLFLLSEKNAAATDQTISKLLHDFDLIQYGEKNPFTLSLGEKKRLTLVSVLAYTPAILILDEPLVGQDSDRLDLLLQALQEHRERGGLTLLICHEPAVVEAFCNRVLFLEAGKLLIDAPVHAAQKQLALLGRDEYLPIGYLLHEGDVGENADGFS